MHVRSLERKGGGNEGLGEEVFGELKDELLVWFVRRAAEQFVLHSPDVVVSEDGKSSNVEHMVRKWLKNTGHAVTLQNAIYFKRSESQRNPAKTTSRKKMPLMPPLPVLLDPVSIIEKARKQWESRLRHELQALSQKQQRPLVRHTRDGAESNDREYYIRFVYNCQDLLETLKAIHNPNCSTSFSQVAEWGLIRMALKTPSFAYLQSKYRKLRPMYRQIGVDDKLMGLEWFEHEKLHRGLNLGQSNTYVPFLKDFLKTGCPSALRGQLWSQALGVDTGRRNTHFFQQLKREVQLYDYITDDLTRFDVQEATDSDEFFVFEDILDEIMLAMSRDKSIPQRCGIPVNTAVLHCASEGDLPATDVPPNQIVPYHRQVMLCTPLCFTSPDSTRIYFLFRALYCRFFAKLHMISSTADSVLYLCALFEQLLQTRAPKLYYHCTQQGVHPLVVAFPWLFSAFSGCLCVDQVLLLWDRIIGYDSMEILPVLAAAIFIYRRNSILQSTSAEELRDVLAELSSLQVIPLVQQFLFGEGTR